MFFEKNVLGNIYYFELSALFSCSNAHRVSRLYVKIFFWVFYIFLKFIFWDKIYMWKDFYLQILESYIVWFRKDGWAVYLFFCILKPEALLLIPSTDDLFFQISAGFYGLQTFPNSWSRDFWALFYFFFLHGFKRAPCLLGLSLRVLKYRIENAKEDSCTGGFSF